MTFSRTLIGTGFAIAAAFAISITPVAAPSALAASEIKIVVNKQAITSVDLSRRVAFLRLQRAKGNLQSTAQEQLVNEALQLQEARRIRVVASDSEVNAAYDRFAQSNRMTQKQLGQVLGQAGVTSGHFKEFIRAQMSWPRVVRAVSGGGSGGKLSNEELVAKMLERGGDKPTTTEYILQQVIFVVPQNKRSNAVIAARKREAEQLRGRFSGCDNTAETAKGLRDVTVRQLGRIMQPELPPDWKPLIEKTAEGKATATRVTDRGVEFLAICKSKTVSDDKAAELVFRAEGDAAANTDEAKKYLEELRKRSVIAKR